MTALPPVEPTGKPTWVATARKALTAAAVGFVGALGASMLDGDITAAESIIAIGTGLVAGGATYTIRNADA